MSKKIIFSENAPAPVGPYSQAVEVNGTIYLSGQIPLDPKTGELVLDSIEAQTQRVMENLKAVLLAADLSMDHVIKCNIFLTDMENFGPVNSVYETYFRSQPPARACVQVSALPKGVDIEIEAIAARA